MCIWNILSLCQNDKIFDTFDFPHRNRKRKTKCHNYFGSFLLHPSIYFMMRSTKFNLPFPMHNKYQMSNRELPNFFLQIERLPLFLPIYQLPSTRASF